MQSMKSRAWPRMALACALAGALAACGGGGGGSGGATGGGTGGTPSGGGSGSAAPPPISAASAPTQTTLAGVPLDTTPAHPVVLLSSDAGDYIGAGQGHAYDDNNARITVQNTGTYLHIDLQGNENWTGDFVLPASVGQWQQGTFTGLTRYPFNTAATGGLNWSGEGRGCNVLSATLTVNSVRYDGAKLSAINFDFEQHCEQGGPALRGHVDWDSQRLTAQAVPLNPIPTDLWSPAAGEMPSSANAMFFVSDPQDYIGQGWTYTVSTVPAGGDSTPPPAGTTKDAVQLSITENAGLLRVTMTGTTINWTGEFKAMDGLAHLQPGYYGIVQRYPFQNPRRGGMNWSMNGRGCNRLNGWFAVDSIVYSGEKLVSVDLRFAQYCDNLVNALRGRIRWTLGSVQTQAAAQSGASN